MKMASLVTAALLVVGSAASAFGAVEVWYTATPTSATAGIAVGGQGSSGNALNLTCVGGGVACTWAITMNANIHGGLVSWGTDLITNSTAGQGPTLSASNGTLSGALPAPGGGDGGLGGTGPNLLLGSNAFTFGNPPTGQQVLLTFNLTRTIAAGNLSVASVLARHFADWGNNDAANSDIFGFDNAVKYGPSQPLNGSTFDDNGNIRQGNLPVINVTGVPEPTSLILLGLGGLVVARRRR